MTDVPKIVHDRLRFPSQSGLVLAHPEADLLTAFAEQALSGPEREGVLTHLALCGDCRKVLALALPADFVGDSTSTVTPVGAPAPQKASLSWPMLRWAALAAAVVVVASVLLVRPGKLNPPTPVSPNPPIANATPSGTQMAASASTLPAVAAPEVPQSLSAPPPRVARSKSETAAFKKSEAAKAGSQTQSGMLLAGNNSAGDSKDSGRLNRPAGSSAPNAAFSYDAAPQPRQTETLEVAGANVMVEARTSRANPMIAQNDAPAIEKAKPALQDTEENKQSKTLTPTAPALAKSSNSRYAVNPMPVTGRDSESFESHASWSIKAGTLQQSVDHGKTWRETLRADHPLSCYAGQGRNIWAGGQAGTLFHSADGGVSWTQVRPTIGSLSLTADVSNIQAPAPGLIVISTSTNETWNSGDAGKTWTKK